MENDGNTALNTTFDTGSDLHHPQMPVHTSPLRCQSTPPRTDTVKMWETPVPAVPTIPHRPLTPCIPLPKPPTYINTAQATAQNQFFRTNNFFIPDGSNRRIHEIKDKVMLDT